MRWGEEGQGEGGGRREVGEESSRERDIVEPVIPRPS